MRVAYADPPYPGQARRHYADHPDYAGEVDHAELVARLGLEYDAWILHTSVPGLREVLPLCPPDVRMLAWAKTWCSWKPGNWPAYAWEPVLIHGGRKGDRVRVTPRDWFSCPAHQQGFTGSKPQELCWWLFDCLYLHPDDELDDLFPGSGAVTRAWEAWRSQLSLLSGAAS